jgi:predicted unusual protein kinase regulating ubiquinone biosynthesis (AarF/ABC1/UbiB family)
MHADLHPGNILVFFSQFFISAFILTDKML